MMNHAAVRSVSLHTLNRQRANIVFSDYFEDKKLLTPKDVSLRERIFEWGGVLRWRGRSALAKARVGVSLQGLLEHLAKPQIVTNAFRDSTSVLSRLVAMYETERYLLWYDCPNRVAYVVLKSKASPHDQLKAWAHALQAAHRLSNPPQATTASTDDVLDILKTVLAELSTIWVACTERMEAVGWDTSTVNIETHSGMRIEPRNGKKGEKA